MVLLIDEMKVREDLVFDRNGEVIGYVDVGDINNRLRKLEKSCKICIINKKVVCSIVLTLKNHETKLCYYAMYIY